VSGSTSDVDAGRRLERYADDRWLLGHAVHLDRPLPGTILHNPRSNLNNAVGYARPDRFGNLVRLGTDGIGADMLEEFRLAFVALGAADVTAAPPAAWGWVGMDEGASVSWSYEPMDPWQLAYTTAVRAVDVTVDGRMVLAAGRATLVDAGEVRARAREQARRLWARL
jgi:hypothetical protein